MVARRLAEKFLEPLILLSEERNYYTSIGGLAEILDWSQEFYGRYYDKIINWETLKCNNHKAAEAVIPDCLINTYGEERLKYFYAQHANNTTTYFLKKYSVIES